METKSTILMKLLQLMTMIHPFGDYLGDLLNHLECLSTSIISSSSAISKYKLNYTSIPTQALGQFHPSFMAVKEILETAG
jgi:hypothetical protein